MFAVAGVSGKTGRVVAESLRAQGAQVRVVVRDPAKGQAWRTRGHEVAVASLDDRAALGRALDGARGFYTLLPEDPFTPGFHAARARMAVAMAGAVQDQKIPHVVFLSTTAAALSSGNGPAQDLHIAENALRASGAIVTALRATFFQENVLMALQPAMKDGVYPSFFPALDDPLPCVATKDVGAIAARCLIEPPRAHEIVDVVGPMYSVRGLADALGAALGKPLRVVGVPAAAQLDALCSAGLPREFAGILVEMFACAASGRVVPQGSRMIAGTTRLEEILPALLGAAR